MIFSDDQIVQLLKPIHPGRVKKDGKGFDHVEAHDVRAHLTRILGFGQWDLQETCELVFEEPTTAKDPKPHRWDVCYRAWARLTLRGPGGGCFYEGSASATASNQSRGDGHDNALKSATSGALKRAAVNAGDQWGLGLYAGTPNAIVRQVIGWEPPKKEDDEQPAEQAAS